jgi:hypothetical protein
MPIQSPDNEHREDLGDFGDEFESVGTLFSDATSPTLVLAPPPPEIDMLGTPPEQPASPKHRASLSPIRSTRLKFQEHLRKAERGRMLRQASGFKLSAGVTDAQAVDDMMESFDVNGDGVFEREEVREMVYSFIKDRRKVEDYRRLLLYGFFVFSIYAAMLYGILELANNFTKSEKPDPSSGVLKAKSYGLGDPMGEVVSTGAVKR